MKRLVVIVLDSVGAGELPDAAAYGDVGSNTLGNIAKAVKGFSLPNLEKLGLGRIEGLEAYAREASPTGCFGRMAEKSAGKDTTTGHWEMSGIILEKPFPTYPEGFPPEVIGAFEKATGTKCIGNYAASGTEIIKELGAEHVRTGYPIVYTSADSVFQIAAHEGVIPIERQYEICKIARDLLKGEHAVGRVIARPFTGVEGSFTRTSNRHDFSLEPVGPTMLDKIKEKGLNVKGVGKIYDIFCGRGITDTVHISNNMEGVDRTLEYLGDEFEGLLFTNLVDFDMIFGHRNNVEGYANALREFDDRLPEIISALGEDDLLVITADHGCDPTTESTDHSREYVPLLVYGKKLKNGADLGTRATFTDLAQTAAEMFDIDYDFKGKSFYKEVIL
ncbi:MAG: phosphopentomutase [Clostridiales bacterium]|nr:phosphopentomutase [Clostridiales bacterium]